MKLKQVVSAVTAGVVLVSSAITAGFATSVTASATNYASISFLALNSDEWATNWCNYTTINSITIDGYDVNSQYYSDVAMGNSAQYTFVTYGSAVTVSNLTNGEIDHFTDSSTITFNFTVSQTLSSSIQLDLIYMISGDSDAVNWNSSTFVTVQEAGDYTLTYSFADNSVTGGAGSSSDSSSGTSSGDSSGNTGSSGSSSSSGTEIAFTQGVDDYGNYTVKFGDTTLNGQTVTVYYTTTNYQNGKFGCCAGSDWTNFEWTESDDIITSTAGSYTATWTIPSDNLGEIQLQFYGDSSAVTVTKIVVGDASDDTSASTTDVTDDSSSSTGTVTDSGTSSGSSSSGSSSSSSSSDVTVSNSQLTVGTETEAASPYYYVEVVPGDAVSMTLYFTVTSSDNNASVGFGYWDGDWEQTQYELSVPSSKVVSVDYTFESTETVKAMIFYPGTSGVDASSIYYVMHYDSTSSGSTGTGSGSGTGSSGGSSSTTGDVTVTPTVKDEEGQDSSGNPDGSYHYSFAIAQDGAYSVTIYYTVTSDDTNTNGAFGYWNNSTSKWVETTFSSTVPSDKVCSAYYVFEGYDVTAAIYWPDVDGVDKSSIYYVLHYDSDYTPDTDTGDDDQGTTGSTGTGNTGAALDEVPSGYTEVVTGTATQEDNTDESGNPNGEYHWSINPNGASYVKVYFSVDELNGSLGYCYNSSYEYTISTSDTDYETSSGTSGVIFKVPDDLQANCTLDVYIWYPSTASVTKVELIYPDGYFDVEETEETTDDDTSGSTGDTSGSAGGSGSAEGSGSTGDTSGSTGGSGDTEGSGSTGDTSGSTGGSGDTEGSGSTGDTSGSTGGSGSAGDTGTQHETVDGIGVQIDTVYADAGSIAMLPITVTSSNGADASTLGIKYAISFSQAPATLALLQASYAANSNDIDNTILFMNQLGSIATENISELQNYLNGTTSAEPLYRYAYVPQGGSAIDPTKSDIMDIYVNLPDMDTIVSIANTYGLTVQTDSNGNSYYAFPVCFANPNSTDTATTLSDGVTTTVTVNRFAYEDASNYDIKDEVSWINGEIRILIDTTDDTQSQDTQSQVTLSTNPEQTTLSVNTTSLTSYSETDTYTPTTSTTTNTINTGDINMVIDTVYVEPNSLAYVPINVVSNGKYDTDSWGIKGAYYYSDATIALIRAVDATVDEKFLETLNFGDAKSLNNDGVIAALNGGSDTPETLFEGANYSGAQKANNASILDIYAAIPDEATVKSIATQYGLELQYDSAQDCYYYEFPITWASHEEVYAAYTIRNGVVYYVEEPVFEYLDATGSEGVNIFDTLVGTIDGGIRVIVDQEEEVASTEETSETTSDAGNQTTSDAGNQTTTGDVQTTSDDGNQTTSGDVQTTSDDGNQTTTGDVQTTSDDGNQTTTGDVQTTSDEGSQTTSGDVQTTSDDGNQTTSGDVQTTSDDGSQTTSGDVQTTSDDGSQTTSGDVQTTSDDGSQTTSDDGSGDTSDDGSGDGDENTGDDGDSEEIIDPSDITWTLDKTSITASATKTKALEYEISITNAIAASGFEGEIYLPDETYALLTSSGSVKDVSVDDSVYDKFDAAAYANKQYVRFEASYSKSVTPNSTDGVLISFEFTIPAEDDVIAIATEYGLTAKSNANDVYFEFPVQWCDDEEEFSYIDAYNRDVFQVFPDEISLSKAGYIRVVVSEDALDDDVVIETEVTTEETTETSVEETTEATETSSETTETSSETSESTESETVSETTETTELEVEFVTKALDEGELADKFADLLAEGEAYGAGFYFSADTAEFDPADIIEIATVNGEDVMDSVYFEYSTPKELFDAESNGAAYIIYDMSVYYDMEDEEGETTALELGTVTIYSAIKGDVDFNGAVDPNDGYNALVYYSSYSLYGDASFTSEGGALEILAYFVADINTESKAGAPTGNSTIDPNDSYYMLVYYANASLRGTELWSNVCPDLKDRTY